MTETPTKAAERRGRPRNQYPTPQTLRELVGSEIRAARLAAGLNLSQLANRTNGRLTPGMISLYESGRMEPRLSKFLIICWALGLSPEVLIPPGAGDVVAAG